MSTIQTQVAIAHIESGLSSGGAYQRTTIEDAFTSSAITVTTAPEKVALGDVVTPVGILIKLVSGDPLKVGFASGTYPMSVNQNSEALLLMLESREISTITAVADVSHSLSNKYFDIADSAGPVRVWFDTGAGAGEYATGTITFNSPTNGDTVVVNATTFTKAAAAGVNEYSTIDELTTLIDDLADISATDDGSIITITADDVGGAGNAITLAETGSSTTISGATLTGGLDASAAPATPTGGRLIEVEFAENANSTTVADAIEVALDTDGAFYVSNSGADLTITDAAAGSRTVISAGTSTFTGASRSGSTPPSEVWMESLGTSSVVVAVAP